MAQCRVLQPAVDRIVRRCGDLVGGDYGDVVSEEVFIESGDILTRGAVHEHRVEYVHAYDFVAQLPGVDLHSSGQFFFPVVEADAVAVENRPAAPRYADYVYLQIPLLHQFSALRGKLFEQLAAHRTDAAHEDVKLLIFRQEETVVYDIERLAQVFPVHYERDVALGRALRAGDDADAVASEGAEELSGYAGVVFHVLADHGHRGELIFDLHREYRSCFYLSAEFPVDRLRGGNGVHAADTYRDACLRR